MPSSKAKGQNRAASLVETLVALLILSVMGAAIVAITLAVISVNNSAKHRNQAAALAEENLELVRSYYQSSDWESLDSRASGGGSCYTNVTTWTAGSGCLTNCSLTNIPGTIFYRYARLISSGGSVKVESSVTWTERGKCNKIQVDTAFFDR